MVANVFLAASVFFQVDITLAQALKDPELSPKAKLAVIALQRQLSPKSDSATAAAKKPSKKYLSARQAARRNAARAMGQAMSEQFWAEAERASSTPPPSMIRIGPGGRPEFNTGGSQPSDMPSNRSHFCGATTLDGTPCRRLVVNGFRCYQHGG